MKHFEFRCRLLSFTKAEELGPEFEDLPDRPSFSQAERALLKEDKEPVGYQSVLLTVFSMCSYTLDVTSSVAACYWLYQTGYWWWYLTLAPLCAALLVVNAFSIRWYVHDAQEEKDYLPQVSVSHWIFRGLFHLFLLGPIVRYLELCMYGLHTCDRKDPDRHKYRLMFLQEDRDISLLVMVGSFMKSAPQLVLQVYILTQSHFEIKLESALRSQAVNVASALVELSLSQTSYHRALRRASPLKHNLTRLATVVHFLSHCCVIASRVLALALFASSYGRWLLAFAAIHWTLMTAWLAAQRTAFCSSDSGQPRMAEELAFNVVMAGVYLFCFVNVKDEPTRWKYTAYYLIVWAENVVLSSLWFVREDPSTWYRLPLLATVIASLAAGLTLLGIYYRFLHPNKTWARLNHTVQSQE